VLHYFPNHGVEEIPDYCSWNSPERFFIFHGADSGSLGKLFYRTFRILW
jgi:hypothetical protein